MQRTFLLVALLVCSTFAMAQDCADWSATMPPPAEYPGCGGNPMVVHGDLLIAFQVTKLAVFSLEDGLPPHLLSEIPFTPEPVAMRVIDDRVYIAAGRSGLVWFDLAAPSEPRLVQVFDNGTWIRDVVAFDGGYIIASNEAMHVVESLDHRSPTILATIDLPIDSVAARGDHAFIATTWGLRPIDLSTPSAPVLGTTGLHYPGEPAFNIQPSYSGFEIDGDTLYASVYFHRSGGTDHSSYLMAFDLSDPMEPEVSHLVERHCGGEIEIVGDMVVTKDWETLAFHEIVSLEYVARIAAGTNPGTVVKWEDQILFGSWFGQDLYGVDTSYLEVVEPLLQRPWQYDAMGCGRFGAAIERVYDLYEFESYIDTLRWTIHDQDDPFQAEPVATGFVNLSPSSSASDFRLHAQNERFLIVGFRYTSASFDDFTSLRIYDTETWAETSLFLRMSDVVLDDELLWIAHYDPCWPSTRLSVYHLTADEPDLVGDLALPGVGARVFVEEEIVVVNGSRILVFERDTPDDPVLLRELPLDPLDGIGGPIFIRDGLLYGASDGEYVVIDLEPEAPGDPVVLSRLDSGNHVVFSTAHHQGTKVMYSNHGYHGGYQVVDYTDPDQPGLVTDLVTWSGMSLLWVDEALYVSEDDAVNLYDVTDLSTPVWVGQSAGGLESSAPCIRGGYLLADEAILPLDCRHITANEDEPEADEIPAPLEVMLLPVAPNPFNPQTVIRFAVTRAQHATVAVYDVRGRRIVDILDREVEPGGHRLTWDGRDAAGREMPSGRYIIRLETETAERSTGAVLVR